MGRNDQHIANGSELGVRWSEGPDLEQGARISFERLFALSPEGVMSPTEVCRGCGGERPGLMNGKRYQLLVACWGGVSAGQQVGLRSTQDRPKCQEPLGLSDELAGSWRWLLLLSLDTCVSHVFAPRPRALNSHSLWGAFSPAADESGPLELFHLITNILHRTLWPHTQPHTICADLW